MRWDLETDFVSVGGGLGGLSAAITAAHHGRQAMVFESTELFGGVAALSLGMLWVPGNHLAAQRGIADRWEEGHEYVRWMSGGYGEEALSRAWCATAAEAVQFFEATSGVRWQLIDIPDYYYPLGAHSQRTGRCLEVVPLDGAALGEEGHRTRTSTSARFANSEMLRGDAVQDCADRRAQGAGLAAYLMRAARIKGVALHANACTRELIVEEGRVCGLLVHEGKQERRVRARCGVLLATSGFDHNRALVRITDARLGHETLVPPAVTGDHLRLAGMLGAKVVGSSVRPQWVGLGFRRVEKSQSEGLQPWQPFGFRKPHAIMVNDAGHRFCDETWGPSYVSALAHVDPNGPRLKNQPCFAVFDSNFLERYPIGTYPRSDPLPEPFCGAMTISALAELLGINPARLQATVARFNLHVRNDADDDFGRGTRPQTLVFGDADYANPVLGSIEKAPFYGVALEAASIGIPTMGLLCDGQARVLNWEGNPIPGLYAAGNSMAMVDLGIGYNSGIANTRGLTFGYLAAIHACG